MEHDDDEAAAKDVQSAEEETPQPSDVPVDTTPNQMKRRISDEGDGEKRLREDNVQEDDEEENDDDDKNTDEGEEQDEQPEPAPPLPATVTEGVTASPDGDNDPQMQVSSLESDYNETVMANCGGDGGRGEDEDQGHEEDDDRGPSTEEDPLAMEEQPEPILPPPSDDFDVASKIQEMDDVTLQAVSKSDADAAAATGDQEPVDEVSLTKKPKEESPESEDKKKNVTNLRKNIRDVIDDTMLDASTLAAQREEQERLNRVQEQQRALRALHRQTDLDKRQSSILSLLQGTLDPTEDPLAIPAVSVAAVRMLDKKTGQVLEEIPDQTSLEPGEIPNPALAAVQIKEAQKSVAETVTIDSSDDDCIMLSDEEEEQDGDDDPHNSGLHVNDAYNLSDEEGRVLVNFGHSDTEQDIFVAPQIARALKPHQIGGIRFLYDNIIESLDRFDSSTGFGCILAHSMGLGKTLQLVCFCDIFLRHTSAKTVLCIMPINTLQNWLAEFNWWLPEDGSKSPLGEAGPVRGRNFKIHVLNDSQKTIAARSKVVLNWAKTGGVLLIGYELYRLLCLKKVVKKRGKRAERDPKYAEKEQAAHGELLEQIYEAVVKPGPDLVVCDEGHRIKSSHASTSVALKQIRTKRRVVLTGYPLQNNLLEYWCMVDFVRPNYLGTKTEFCNMFEKPIQNGQCIDSTPQDIKLMRYRAHVLHSLLLGFVQRRSHLVLQSTLPNKLEYVMLVRMTAFQRKLYDVFMNEVVRKKAVPNPLKAFAVCCKIWNHPDVLYNFLKKREADLDLELEEEMAMQEAKKVRKEREKKVKEEEKKIKEEEKRIKAEKEAKELQNGVKVEESLVPKMESQSATGMLSNYQQQNQSYGNSFGMFNSSTDPLAAQQQGTVGSGSFNPYGSSSGDYYSQQPYGGNNHNSYQSAYGGQQHPHQQQQYYGSDPTGGAGAAVNGLGKDNKMTYWNNQYGSNGYYDQTSQQYSQNYINPAPAAFPPPPPVIPTSVTDPIAQPDIKAKEVKAEDDDDGEDDEELEEGEIKKKGKAESPEKETKSSRDDGIPYEWAVELMKDYVPDLLENAPKMEIFFCILNESLAIGDRILVFSQSLLTLNLIERYLQRHKVPKREEFWSKNTNYFRLDGSTTACDRERLINEFNSNEDVGIFLVSTRAGSLGINLVGANRVIVFDASWNPCHDTQAVCRVYRYGQKKQCYVYRMVMDNCLEKRIYDRQVNKQGMSDRVVDECNPDAHLSIKEVTNLCWDNDEETEVKDFSDQKDQYPDMVMQKVLEKFSPTLSKEPFRHESLLVDRKEKKLSMAEKRLAQRGYELEKQASTKPAYNYAGKVTQYRVFRTADGSLVHRAVGTVPSQNSTTTGAPVSGGKWIPAEVWRQQGMTTQETTLPADVTIPSNSGDKNAGIVLKAGQKVMILKSSKGVYMQLETGKIIAIRTGPKTGQPVAASRAPMNVARPRGFGDTSEVIKLDDDDEDADDDDSDDDDAEEGEIKPGKQQQHQNGDKKKKKEGKESKRGASVAVKLETNIPSVASSSSSSSSSSTAATVKLNPTADHHHQMSGSQSSSSSTTGGYYDSNTYPGSYPSTGGYRQQSAQPLQTPTNRDYNSYSTGAAASGAYAESRGDYHQQQQSQSKSYNQPAGQSTSAAAQVTSQGYPSAGTGSSFGSLYGAPSVPAAASSGSGPEGIPSNGQYGSATGTSHHPPQQQQQHRATVPSAYPPQSSYDYSTRYYDQQSKALASQFNQSAAAAAASVSHYPPQSQQPPANVAPVAGAGGAYQSAYSSYHHPHHQHPHHNPYGQQQRMPGEYNPNNPPYYMNPYGASGGSAAAASGGGLNPYQTQGYGQDAVVSSGVGATAAAGQQQGMGQELLQQPQSQYSDANALYGQQYGNPYNGPASSATGGGGKVDAPVNEPHKKKESSRRKGSDSAFHKPSTAEIGSGTSGGGVGGVEKASRVMEKKEATAAANSNYYDRPSGSSGSSTSYSAFPSPYSPYNYPPSVSPYFYPGSYCPPPPPPLGEQSLREGKETKGRSTDSKYYDLNRTSGQHYQPPKW